MTPPPSSANASLSTGCALSHLSQRNSHPLPAYYMPINLTLIVVYVSYVVLTTVWFALERHKTIFLLKRSLLGIITSAVGGGMILLLGPVRNIDPENFPCDLTLVCMTLCVPFSLTPVALRLYQFRNQLEWNKHLALTSVHKLNDATGHTVAQQAASLVGGKKHRKLSVYHGAASVRVAGSGGGDEMSQSQMSGSRMQAFTMGLWFRSSVWFPIIIFTVSVLFFFLVLTVPFLVSQPFYSHGCRGCLFNPVEQTVSAVGALLVGQALIYFAWDIRLEKDPLEIKSEILYMLPVALLPGTVGIFGIMIDAWVNGSAYGDSGVVQFEWFLILTVLWIHHSMCPKQILKSRLLTKVTGMPARSEFQAMLRTEAFFKLFEAHCVKEFSTENIKFYDAVEVFESKHASMTPADRVNLANEVFAAFLGAGSVMQINVKHDVSNAIAHVMTGDHPPQDVPKNLFSSARDEILDLMYRDSFVRMTQTAEYKNWTTHTVVSRGGEVLA